MAKEIFADSIPDAPTVGDLNVGELRSLLKLCVAVIAGDLDDAGKLHKRIPFNEIKDAVVDWWVDKESDGVLAGVPPASFSEVACDWISARVAELAVNNEPREVRVGR